MTIPAPITRLTSFTAFQQGQGDNTFPGTSLDAELDQTNNTLDALIAAVRAILRADGVLANGSVPRSALAADVMLGLGASRPWSSTVTYAVNATVTRGYGLYVALLANSGTDPLGSSTAWALQADLSQAVVIADGSIVTSSFAAKAVTEPKLADGAVSNRVIAAQAVDRSKAAVNLGVLPVGAETDYAGIVLPAGFLWCTGQVVSRTTYADLFRALSFSFLADATTGSSTLTNVNTAFVGIGLIGAVLEGPGVPAGTTLVTDAVGNVTTSAALTSSATQGAFRLLPYGRGDGSTTFNVPDRRDRVTLGRGNMDGSAAGRLTGVMTTSGLGLVRDSATMTLTNSHLPVALPGGAQVTVTYAAHTYVGAGATVNIANGSGNIFQNIMQQPTNIATTPPANQTFNVSGLQNPGGGQSFATLQPTSVANKIIFAGV